LWWVSAHEETDLGPLSGGGQWEAHLGGVAPLLARLHKWVVGAVVVVTVVGLPKIVGVFDDGVAALFLTAVQMDVSSLCVAWFCVVDWR
jgi:hypothetical protein